MTENKKRHTHQPLELLAASSGSAPWEGAGGVPGGGEGCPCLVTFNGVMGGGEGPNSGGALIVGIGPGGG